MTTRVTSEILDRLPPQDLNAEKAVLGSILLDPSVLDDVASTVKASDFYADANQKIYRRLQAMHDDGKRIDVLLLVECLKQDGDFESVGGTAYLAEVAQSVPYAANAVYYAEMVRERAVRRAIIHAGTDMIRSAWDLGAEVADTLDAAEKTISRAATGLDGKSVVTASEATAEFLDRVDKMTQNRDACGVFTGLERFDAELGGFLGGELVIIAARPSVGKTSLAAQIAEHGARHGRLAYYASLEMKAWELAARSIMSAAGVNSTRFRAGSLSGQDMRAIAEAANVYAPLPLAMDNRGAMGVADIRREARKLARKGLRLVVVDYIQLLAPAREDRAANNREREVAGLSRALKAMAQELDVPVICLSQLNRDVEKEKRTPTLRDLRESGAIEQDADAVLFLHPDASDDHNTIPTKLLVAKFRNGPRDVKYDLVFYRSETRFEHAGASSMANYESSFDQYGGEF